MPAYAGLSIKDVFLLSMLLHGNVIVYNLPLPYHYKHV